MNTFFTKRNHGVTPRYLSWISINTWDLINPLSLHVNQMDTFIIIIQFVYFPNNTAEPRPNYLPRGICAYIIMY